MSSKSVSRSKPAVASTRRVAKKEEKVAETASVAETVAVPQAESVPVVASTSAETVAETTAVASTSAVADTSAASFATMMTAYRENLTEMRRTISTLSTACVNLERQLKLIERQHNVEAKRKVKRVIKHNPDKAPSGIMKQVQVSPQMYKFLAQYDVKSGTLVSRTDMARFLNRYIKEKNLKNPEHGGEFIPDKSLADLLGPAQSRRVKDDATSPLVYKIFGIQSYLGRHVVASS